MTRWLALLLIACNARDDGPKPAPPPPAAAARPAPSSDVTGHPSKDPNVTIDRCVKTSWSYLGCAVVFPVQGRQWIADACATTTDATVKRIVCARQAEYRLHGIGGPVEREAGMKTLTELCDQNHRVDCAALIDERMWADRDAQRAMVAHACDEDPRNSPVGLCDHIHRVMSDGFHVYTVTLDTADGVAGVAVGATCKLGLVAQPPNCLARLDCNDRPIYGDGGSEFPCKLAGGKLTGGEAMTSSEDNDPAIAIDLAAGTLDVRDDAGPAVPALHLHGTVK